MSNLWNDLKFHTGIAGDNFLEKSFVGRILKGTYDSVDRQANPQNRIDDAGNFYPGQQPGQLEDAFNTAGFAMTGSLPFAPKGAGTLAAGIKLPDYTTRAEYDALGKSLPSPGMLDDFAHIIRGDRGYGLGAGSKPLPLGKIGAFMKEYRNGKHLKDDDWITNTLEDFDNLISHDTINNIIKKSPIELDKPLYIARSEWSDTVSKPRHLMSTKVVDPTVPSQYNRDYHRGPLEDGPSEGYENFVKSTLYRLDKNTPLYHPRGLADGHEALIMRKTLDEADQISILKYLEMLANGKPPF